MLNKFVWRVTALCVLSAAPVYLSAMTAPESGKDICVTGPDGRLTLKVGSDSSGRPGYSVAYDGREMLARSPLGFIADYGNFADSMVLHGCDTAAVRIGYTLRTIKKSSVDVPYRRLLTHWENNRGRRLDIEFMVSDNDVAFRYCLPRDGENASVRILAEATGFCPVSGSTTFMTAQSDAMAGWKRTKPSYEEKYRADAPMDVSSEYGHGYTFPALFHTPAGGWMLVSETGVGSDYCASRLSEYGSGGYTVEFPMPEENNGNGTSEPAFSLPGHTPWRTVTVGSSLAPIVETTVMWDVAQPRYTASEAYAPGRGTWSWILWQDDSINFDDQKRYIDFAAEMGYEFTLVDNWWDSRIGRERIKELAEYARSKGVSLILWYSSSGYWNDIAQSPVNRMDNSIHRKAEMKWLRDIGVKAIKVDFFGGDKQETMRLYEQILSDADDYGIMVIFHGCTLPRGWERMYPNYIGSEAVLASENMVFTQEACDAEAFNATLHPFIRNTVGAMEFGGVFLNRRLNRGNDGGSERRTSDVFQLATAVLFQSPAQNFALAPNNLTDAPKECIDFMRQIPTTWDEVRFIDGYPGRHAVIARRSGSRWYVAAVNAMDSKLHLDAGLAFLAGREAAVYTDGRGGSPEKKQVVIPETGILKLEVAPLGGTVIVCDTAGHRLTEVGPGYCRTSVNGAVFRGSSVVSHGGWQYTAYYDRDGYVTVARRRHGSDEWETKRSVYKGNVADGHNVISIGADGDGYLHVAFDHHGSPLHYCRATAPGSIELGPMEPMTGENESDVTYPEFYTMPDGDMLFAYRSGASGCGNLVLNRYDSASRRWQRVQDVLIDGEGKRNAYWQMYVDSAGVIYLSWVWRETWLVETNHDLCFACSRDGGHTWERSDGSAYSLPITEKNAEIAWSIPQNSNLINQTGMTADGSGHPYIATYWSDGADSVPQYRLVWHNGSKWQMSEVGRRTMPFSLAGGGTKMIPMSRPRIASDGKAAYYLFRDQERGSRVSVAYTPALGSENWKISDVTDFQVGAWEPTYDTELWNRSRKLHIFVQKMYQGDGERVATDAPESTPVYVLEYNTIPEHDIAES